MRRPYPAQTSVWRIVLGFWLSLLMAESRSSDARSDQKEDGAGSEQTSAGPTTRSGYEDVPQTGGPTSPSVSLLRADIEKESVLAASGWSDLLSERWFSTKQSIFEDHGLAFGLSYTILGQRLNGAEDSSSSGGVFDAAVSWTLLGRESGNTGTLVMLLENQHSFGSGLTPEESGVAAGSAVPTASFGDSDWQLTNMHWSQKLAGNSAILLVGVVDPVDYVDYFAFNDPLTAFSNVAFAGSPTIPLPDPGFGTMLHLNRRDFYLSMGITDGNPATFSTDIKDVLTDGGHFSHVEVGITPSYRQRLVDNLHLTFWHQAELPAQDLPEDWGVALSLTSRVGERLVPFFRAGISQGEITQRKKSIGAGLGYRLRSFDLFGIAVNWGEATENARDQFTTEAFYRFQFAPMTTITPHLQLIRNPALDPDQSSLVGIGLRMRIAL